jgi:hypothetical protein
MKQLWEQGTLLLPHLGTTRQVKVHLLLSIVAWVRAGERTLIAPILRMFKNAEC